MKVSYVSQHTENMNSIREVYGIVKTDQVSSFVGNPWAIGWLWLILYDLRTSEVKRGFISNSFLPSEGLEIKVIQRSVI